MTNQFSDSGASHSFNHSSSCIPPPFLSTAQPVPNSLPCCSEPFILYSGLFVLANLSHRYVIKIQFLSQSKNSTSSSQKPPPTTHLLPIQPTSQPSPPPNKLNGPMRTRTTCHKQHVRWRLASTTPTATIHPPNHHLWLTYRSYSPLPGPPYPQ